MSVEISSNGPVFDNRGPQIAQDAADAAGREIARWGINAVRSELDRVLQHPTGRYRASIHAEHYGSQHEVDDDNQVYGPWLDGSGSRNRTTRFKGYAHWRRAAQQLDRQSERIAGAAISPFVRRLNG